ncbi:MAG: LLM class F420-dependent oxidoreductase [Myxococcota bacterium]|jgi:probable F420-dependent oxidoreductase|nr:LLM class F420-dependent oxidoreductase [Myxococcota bacterium]
MKIGIIGINIGAQNADQIIRFAQRAEEIGLESIWTFEHVMVPIEYESAYPYTADGKMAATPETNMVDPLITLSAIAAATTTLRLGTGVNILPQTNPLSLAKQAASLDFMSNGRFMLGVGIGWLAEEFKAMGVPFERRGARHDDYAEAMQKVWSGDVVEHQSDFLDWSGFKSYPLPVQKPFPLVIGGSKGKIFDRVARFGRGWYAPASNLASLREMMAPLDEACREVGRERASVEVSTMWVPQLETVDVVPQYEEAGVDRLVVPLVVVAGGGDPIDGLERFGDEVVSKLV